MVITYRYFQFKNFFMLGKIQPWPSRGAECFKLTGQWLSNFNLHGHHVHVIERTKTPSRLALGTLIYGLLSLSLIQSPAGSTCDKKLTSVGPCDM